MEGVQKDLRVQKLNKEVSCDYVLPDFKGDIKKVLCVRVCATPLSKVCADNRLEFNGIVNYNLLYLDMDNKITSIDFESDFNFVEETNTDTADGMADVTVSGATVRLFGPRKVNVKAFISCTAKISEEKALPSPTCEEGICPEYLYETIDVLSSNISETRDAEYSEEIYQQKGYSADDIEILTSGGYVFVTDSTPTENGVELSGFYELYAVISTPDEPALAISKRFKFTETVPIEYENADRIDLMPNARMTSLKLDVSESDEGVSVVASAAAEYQVGIFNNERIRIAKDAVVPMHKERCEFDDFAYTALEKIETKVINLNGNVAREGTDEAFACRIAYAHGRVKNVSANIVGREYQISGEIYAECVTKCVNEDADTVFGCEKLNIPFTTTLSIDYMPTDGATVDAFAKLCSIKIKQDVDSYYYEAEAQITLVVLNKRHTSVLSSVSATPLMENDDYTVTVIYPEKNESLWDIAKLTHTSPTKIAEKNTLSATYLSDGGKQVPLGVKKLII